MPTLLALTLIATSYSHVGPLYCGGHTETMTEPWIALPVEMYETGEAMCGDLYYLRFGNGTNMFARALDAGPFGGFCVMTGGRCVPIGVDVPERWKTFVGLSCGVEMYNITAEARKAGMW